MKLTALASLVHGEIIGDQDIDIRGVSGILEAQEGDITFLSSKKYVKDLPQCKASCLIVKEPLKESGITQLKVSNPYLAYAKLLEYFYVKPQKPIGISKQAFVSDTAHLGKDVSVFPFAYISDGASIGDGTVIYPYVYIGEGTSVGERCVLYPHVTLREKIKVGNNVIIHAGSVIGSDGFGYVLDGATYHKIPQVGSVVIEDNVEIGSNVSIDRATTGETTIGKGTKIDNLVQIAHNVTIGKNSIVVSQVGIAGSTEIGDYVTLGGQVGIVDHLKIESQTMIGAQSGIMSSLSKGIYSGSPALPHREWLKSQAVFVRLPELQKRIRELEGKIKELERRASE